MSKAFEGVSQLLVIQATPFCNLDCSYCYLPDRGDRRRMSEATLRASFRRVFESPFLGEQLTVVWHSGEPLVLPIEYYRRAFAIAEEMRPGCLQLTHSFQTNATLITDAWVTFFRESGARVGVSIDGPADLHDRHRRTRSGHPTFDRVLAGIRALQRGNVPFHVISVLTRRALAEPDRLYNFYREHGIDRICLNIEEIESGNSASSLAAPEVIDEYRHFLTGFLKRVKQDGERAPWVREMASTAQSIVRESSGDHQQTTPFAIISIDFEGNVSTYSPELLGMKSTLYNDFIIGNVHKASLAEMGESLTLQRMQRDIQAGVELCRCKCQYFELCGGGAPANKLAENGSFASTETMFCRLTKMALVDVVLDDIEEALRDEAAEPRQVAS